MEISQWAYRLLTADTLAEKLLDPGELTDHTPGPPLRISEPTRPPGMGFSRKSRKEKLPPLAELGNSDNRAICLHRFAGHELLAVEIMAQALLAFPEAPPSFRKGLCHTLREEQRHVQLYCDRLAELGLKFGDLPLYRHFWIHVPGLTDPLHYVSLMSLTFEMANLDFAPMYGKAFEQHGDLPSSALMAQILQDEIRHVRFGWKWLCHWKKEHLSTWETWKQSLPPKVSPSRATGPIFQEAPRRAAHLPPEWINHLSSL